MKRPIIKCGCCNGKGKRPLGADLWTTLQKMGSNPLTTDDLLEEGISPNAICNRLRKLDSLGLVRVTGKKGKLYQWVRNEPEGEGRKP